MKVLWFGLLFGLFAIGSQEVRRFEGDAAREIAAKLHGDAKRVSVRIRPAGLSGALASATIDATHFDTEGLPLYTEPERSTRGVVHELRIRLHDFRLNGLRVERLSATMPDCRFDYSLAVRHRQIRLSRCGTGHGTVTLLAKDLGDFIVRKYAEIKRAKVTIEGNRIHVSGYGEFLVISTNFDIDAKLEVLDGTQFVLRDCRVKFDGNEADPTARDALLETLNPVVDLQKDLSLANAILVDKVVLVDGRIEASGRTTIPVRG